MIKGQNERIKGTENSIPKYIYKKKKVKLISFAPQKLPI